MVTFASKLIVLRGNSASGKSTTAHQLRTASSRKIALVEQDYLRRIVLKERDHKGANNVDLIYQTVTFALSRGYDVVLEGILYFPHYGAMLRDLVGLCPDHHLFYFDVSSEETLRRHATKPIAQEVSAAQLRAWYHHRDLTHFPSERIIPESSSIAETVRTIVEQTGL
jgi:predicted kinase